MMIFSFCFKLLHKKRYTYKLENFKDIGGIPWQKFMKLEKDIQVLNI